MKHRDKPKVTFKPAVDKEMISLYLQDLFHMEEAVMETVLK